MKERYYSESLLRSLAYEDNVNGNCDGKIDFTVVDTLSGADVVPVRHGKWTGFPNNGVWSIKCSECHRLLPFGALPEEMEYCPHCGTKMNEGESSTKNYPHCHKCIHETVCSKDKDNDHTCPDYRRDAPDGGFYG